MSIGRVQVSCSITLQLVYLYAPVTIFKHFLWILLRGLIIFSGILLLDPASAQIGNLQVKASRTMALYTYSNLWKNAPHVDCVNIHSANDCDSALVCVILMWLF